MGFRTFPQLLSDILSEHEAAGFIENPPVQKVFQKVA
jgi:hypothetical protein